MLHNKTWIKQVKRKYGRNEHTNKKNYVQNPQMLAKVVLKNNCDNAQIAKEKSTIL